MTIETFIGSFIGIAFVVIVAILVGSLLIWGAVLIWMKGIFPLLDKRDTHIEQQ